MKNWFINVSQAFVLLFLLCARPAGTYAQQTKTVTISGHINTTAPTLVEDFSDYQYFARHTMERSFIPDSSGNFSITFPLESPNYFRIHRSVLYLTPGDHLVADLDQVYNTKAVFKGDDAAACTYLNKIAFPKGGSYLEAGEHLYPDAVRTLDSILATARQRRAELAALTGITDEFRRLEGARIKADVLVSIQAIPLYIAVMNKAENRDLLNTFNVVAAPVIKDCSKDFIDTSFMKLEVYRDIMGGLVKGAPENAGVTKIRDWLKVRASINEMTAIGDNDKLEAFRDKFNSIHTAGYKNAALKYLDGLQHFGKGDYAEDVICYTTKGKRFPLSDLKGKLIYVDLWATWCMPCLAEMPAFTKLKEKYKDNPNVAFVSLSIDDEGHFQDWVKNVEDRKADGLQLEANRLKLSAYNIVGIPRTLLIDKDFKIIDMNAELPSSPSLPGRIDSLLAN